MGNRVGFEVQQDNVKIAVLCNHAEDILFMDQMKSTNKRYRAPLNSDNGVVFCFKYTMEEFLKLKSRESVIQLRMHFQQQLGKPNIDIFMNTETSVFIEKMPLLKAALKELLKADFTPRYRHNYAASVLSLECLNYFAKESQFFKFTSQVTASQLHLITSKLEYKKEYCQLPNYPYLLGSLRKGAMFFKVEAVNQIEKVSGSIIGELTICSILEMLTMNKYNDLEELINRSLETGNNRNCDLLVEDIYGKTIRGLGIDGNIIASSMAKVAQEGSHPSIEDQCKSLFLAFAINVSQFLALQMRLLNLNHCILLANKFHCDYFYYTVQSLVKFFKPDAQVYFAELGNFMSCLGNIDFSQ